MSTVPCRDEEPEQLSRAVQEYLVAIARLRQGEAPVPLSKLAGDLGISPVSANEMCRKLQDHGLAIYRPYKGVTLSPEGNEQALYVLRRHRLWEVFLVDHLGMTIEEAHVAACGLEHETSAAVASHLDRYLKQPVLSPEGQPIPSGREMAVRHPTLPLDQLQVGQGGVIATVELSGETGAYLAGNMIRPGSTITLRALSPGALLVATNQGELAIERSLAENIHVIPHLPPRAPSTAAGSLGEVFVPKATLEALGLGQPGIVLHVQGQDPVRRRLLDMGFSPGVIVTPIKAAPLRGPIEFEVRGYHVSLRRAEASQVLVQPIENET